ncbi:MAG: hypothetical protein JST51_14745 [Armatimonadetes bacterium]|nr:hypothetical protein [Armatimonadota bacterium]
MDKIDNQREKAIEALGDKSYEMRWSKSLAFGWACGYLYLFWIVLMPLGVFIKFPSPGLAMATSFVGAGVLAAFAGWRIHRRGERYRVRFDKSGFSFWFDQEPYLQLRWIDIRELSFRRGDLVVTRTDGRVERAKFPMVERTRGGELLRGVLRTFRVTKDRQKVQKRNLWIATGMALIGFTLAFALGRPAMMSRDFEGTIGLREVLDLARWLVGAIGGILGLLVVAAHLMARLTKWASNKNRARPSQFGPNIETFLLECNRWPKPIELVEGACYRYFDPDGMHSAIKEKVGAQIFTSVMIGLFGVCGLAVLFFQPATRVDIKGNLFLVVGCVFLITFAIYFAKLAQRQNRLHAYIEDRITVSGNHLIVERSGQTLSFPRRPLTEMADKYTTKEAIYPFGRIERHGVGPNQYLLDRRYLMAIPDDLGLASEDVVGDGVEHVTG